jgi:putative ABC transport system ATP-binding protein
MLVLKVKLLLKWNIHTVLLSVYAGGISEGKGISMENILSVENISKVYKNGEERVAALKDVSFQLKKGEMLAIMGSSGSGKSTILHILGALDKPDRGSIYLNNKYEKQFSMEPYATKIRSQYIGFVFQQYNLLNDLTVKENIALPLILSNHSESEINEFVNEKIALTGLKGRENHRPFELSGGQQQRVAIARAIITKPKILLADEPTGNLDYNTAMEIMELLKKMNQELGQSTIIVTHDPMVASYADRVIFFHDGRLRDEHINKSKEEDVDEILYIFRNLIKMKD